MIAGTVSQRNYDVKVADIVWKRHEEQLRPRYIPTTQHTESKQSEHRQPERNLFSPVLRETVPDIDLIRAEGIFTQEHEAYESEEKEREASIPVVEPKLNEQSTPEDNDSEQMNRSGVIRDAKEIHLKGIVGQYTCYWHYK